MAFSTSFFAKQGFLKNLNIQKVESIIVVKNKFILIKYTISGNNVVKVITWKDSYRIFPVSLNDLCKTFDVEGCFATIKFSEKYSVWLVASQPERPKGGRSYY